MLAGAALGWLLRGAGDAPGSLQGLGVQASARDRFAHVGRAPPFAGAFERLVVVAGHGVVVANDFKHAERNDAWLLEPYQRVEGEAASFVQHIRLGVQQAAGDERAMLLFSGGETRRDAGPISEGQTYWKVADAEGWFGHAGVRERAFTEEAAHDSMENLLFSMCRYEELTGGAPQHALPGVTGHPAGGGQRQGRPRA